MKNRTLYLIIALMTAVLVAGYFLYPRLTAQSDLPKPQPAAEAPKTFNYICADSKTLQMQFVDKEMKKISVKTEDKTFELNQSLAASGIRYTSADESVVFWSKGENATLTENGVDTHANCVETPKQTSLANPASVNCSQKGGSLKMEKLPNGSEIGVCNFEDARVCEEWALFRNECPVGGLKVTGYTPSERFCVITGGTVSQGSCQKNQKTCPIDNLYSGTCTL